MKNKNNALRIIRTIDLKKIDDALKNKNFLSVIFTISIQTLSSPILTSLKNAGRTPAVMVDSVI